MRQDRKPRRRIAALTAAVALFALAPAAEAQRPARPGQRPPQTVSPLDPTPPPAATALESAVQAALERAAPAAALAAAEAALATDPTDDQARFARGTAHLALAVQTLGQSLYRHGLVTVDEVPILRLPVPANGAAEPLTYEGFRAILDRFERDLATAEASLGEVTGHVVGPAGQDSPTVLALDFAKIALDLDGDGTASAPETFQAIFAALAPQAGQRPGGPPSPLGWAVAFDHGDALWMRGYCNITRALLQFWLAHDFERSFKLTFHGPFPHAGLPLAESWRKESRPERGGFPVGAIADIIAFVHTFDWPVVERARLQQAVDLWASVPALSRQSWAAIRAETDNDREWLPTPRQTNRFPALAITDAAIDGWLRALDAWDEIMQGRLLVPHFRFARGFDLRRALLEHERFDPVLWATGHELLPYLQDGPVLDDQRLNQIGRAITGNFFAYFIRFN